MGVGAAIAASAVVGAGASIYGANKTAGAAKDAANLQRQAFETGQINQAPFISGGQAVMPNLLSVATSGPTGGGPDYISQAAGAQPGTMTQAQLEAMPGYQWIRDQNLKSIQAQNAAKGLGVSGAEMKGAGEYVTGLANQTYMNAFQQQQQRFANLLGLNTAQQANLTNQFGRLYDVARMGANTAVSQGTQGIQSAAQAGGANVLGAQAGQAGLTNATNALTGGLNNYLGYQYNQELLKRMPNYGTGGTVGIGQQQYNDAYQQGAFAQQPPGTYGPFA